MFKAISSKWNCSTSLLEVTFTGEWDSSYYLQMFRSADNIRLTKISEHTKGTKKVAILRPNNILVTGVYTFEINASGVGLIYSTQVSVQCKCVGRYKGASLKITKPYPSPLFVFTADLGSYGIPYGNFTLLIYSRSAGNPNYIAAQYDLSFNNGVVEIVNYLADIHLCSPIIVYGILLDPDGCIVAQSKEAAHYSSLFLNVSYDDTKGLEYSHTTLTPELCLYHYQSIGSNGHFSTNSFPPKGTKLPPGTYCYSISKCSKYPFDFNESRSCVYKCVTVADTPNNRNNVPIGKPCSLLLGDNIFVFQEFCNIKVYNLSKDPVNISIEVLIPSEDEERCEVDGFWKSIKSSSILPDGSYKTNVPDKKKKTRVVVTSSTTGCRIIQCLDPCESFPKFGGEDKTPSAIELYTTNISNTEYVILENTNLNSTVTVSSESNFISDSSKNNLIIPPGEVVGIALSDLSTDSLTFTTKVSKYPKRKVTKTYSTSNLLDYPKNVIKGILIKNNQTYLLPK